MFNKSREFGEPFFIKQNDTYPPLMICLYETGNLGQKQQFNLSAATAVTFSMTDKYGNCCVYKKAATISNAKEGIVQYNWDAVDTEETGRFSGEFELSFSGGGIMTYPAAGNIPIRIADDLH